MYQDYPLFRPGQSAPSGIRLQLAALIACVDSDIYSFPGSEVKPYQLPEEDDGTKVHAFTWVKPTGALAKAVADVSAALCRSVLRKEVEPLALVIGLDDEVDPFNTWLSAKDVEAWCSQRLLPLGDLWDRFLEEADHIEVAAMEAAVAELDALESLERKKAAKQHWWNSLDPAVQDKVLTYFAPADVDPHTPQTPDGEKPLRVRERDSLVNVLGALLRLHLDDGRFGKQEALIKAIVERWGSLPGVSDRNLQKLFPEAKRRVP